MQSFQSRIALFFSALLVGVQGLILLGLYWIARDNVIEQLDQNLVYAERFLHRLLTDRGRRIAGETRILVADFGFRATVSEGDADTIASALQNLVYRIHGQRAFYVALGGRIVADTAGRYREVPFMFPRALTMAEESGRAVVFGLLDGELYEWAVVPVLAPTPIGSVAIAIPVDRGLVNEFKHLSTLPLDITLAELSGDESRILASSLPADMQGEAAAQWLNRSRPGNGQSFIVDLGGDSYLTRLQSLPSARADPAIHAALQINLAAALRPYLMLLYAVSGLLILGLLATLAGSWILARRLARPVEDLASATRELREGRPAEPLPVTRQDELGQLAETFNRASRLATQMQDLQQRDNKRRAMVATVSHDLRTPLTSLHGFLETLRRKADSLPAEEHQRFLEVALRQTEKVSRMAGELFELARLECDDACVQWEEFCLPELLQDVAQKYRITAVQRGVALTADLRRDLPLVRGDIGLIERVLTNLIDNAIKNTPSGGRVRVYAQPLDGCVEVSVADTGEGIPPEYQSRLFDWDSPLGRRSGPDSGGLGLIVVARIVSLHGSAIRVVSEPGAGSTFTFDLPVAAQRKVSDP